MGLLEFSDFFDRTIVPFSCFLISDGSLHSWKNSGSGKWCSMELAVIEPLNSSGPCQVFRHSYYV